MQKGPYFQNVEYVSPLPQGYMQAASNISNAYASALKGLGDSIASGIEKYKANKAENEAANAAFQNEVAPGIKRISDAAEIAKKDPSNADANRLAAYSQDEGVKKVISKFGDFDKMSLSQKKSFLDSARNVQTRIERDELKNYTRNLETQNMALKQRQVAADETRAAAAVKSADADVKRAEATFNSASLKQNKPTFVSPEAALAHARQNNIKDTDVNITPTEGGWTYGSNAALEEAPGFKTMKEAQDYAVSQGLKPDQISIKRLRDGTYKVESGGLDALKSMINDAISDKNGAGRFTIGTGK